MTLSTTDSRFSYDGDGSTVAFSFPRKVIEAAHLKVYLYDEDDDSMSLQTLNSHYTFAGSGLSNGIYASATITFSTAPGSDKKVVIFRDPALTQEQDFTAETNVLNALNRLADRVEMKLQRVDDRLDRAVVLPDGDYASGLTNSYAKADFANKVLGFDASGNIEPSAGIASSAAMEDVVDADTIQIGRRLLNAGPWFNVLDYVSDATVRAAILAFTQTADVSSYIQAACDAADDVGGKIYFPPGRYPILSTVTTEGVSFVGEGFVEDLYPYGTKGTVFVFTSTANTPFKLGESVSFEGIVFFWPNQIEDRATWVANSNGPIVYPPLFENTNTSTTLSGFSFRNNVVLNAYDFMDVGGAGAFDKGGRWTFSGNRIFALRRYFNLNNIPDVVKCATDNIWGMGVYADEVLHFSGGGAGATVSVSSITRSSTTATVTTAAAHGLSSGQKVTIAGASQSDYNGTFVITVTDTDEFTYTVSGSPATPATGTITSTAFYLRDYAIANSTMLRVPGDATVSARSTYSVDGFTFGGLHYGMRRVIDVDGGFLNVVSTKGAIFDAVQQIVHTRNYGGCASIEADLGGTAYVFKLGYTETATPPVFEIDTPAPSGSDAVTTLSVRGNLNFCNGTLVKATGVYVKAIDVDCQVESIGHDTTTAGTYYVAELNCSAAHVTIEGRYGVTNAASGVDHKAVLVTAAASVSVDGVFDTWDCVVENNSASAAVSFSGKTFNDAGDAIQGTYAGNVKVAQESVIDSQPSLSEPAGDNALINGSFDIWQRGTSFASGAIAYTVDRFKFTRGSAAAGATLSRQTGFSGAQYCARIARDSANSATDILYAAQQIETPACYAYRGMEFFVGFDGRAGADFSAADDLLSVTVFTGTGNNETVNVATGFATGNASETKTVTLSTTAGRHVVGPFSIPTNATEIAIVAHWTPVGTAGAADHVEITRMSAGNLATAQVYRPRGYNSELNACKRFYRRLGRDLHGRWESATQVMLHAQWDMRTDPTPTLLDDTPTVSEVGVANRTGTSSTIYSSSANSTGGFYGIDGFSSATAGRMGAGGQADIIALTAEIGP